MSAIQSAVAAGLPRLVNI